MVGTVPHGHDVAESTCGVSPSRVEVARVLGPNPATRWSLPTRAPYAWRMERTDPVPGGTPIEEPHEGANPCLVTHAGTAT